MIILALKIWSWDSIEPAEVEYSDSTLKIQSKDNMETACRSIIILILHWQSDQRQYRDCMQQIILLILYWKSGPQTYNLKTAGVDNSDSAPTIRSNNNIETACVNNHDSAVEINHVKDNTETVLIDESPFRSDVPHTPFLLKKSNLPWLSQPNQEKHSPFS